MTELITKLKEKIQTHFDIHIDLKRFNLYNNISISSTKLTSLYDNNLFKLYMVTYYQLEFDEVIRNLIETFNLINEEIIIEINEVTKDSITINIKEEEKRSKENILPNFERYSYSLVQSIESYIEINNSFNEYLNISVNDFALYNEMDYKVTNEIQQLINKKVVEIISENIIYIYKMLMLIKNEKQCQFTPQVEEHYNNLLLLVEYVQTCLIINNTNN